MIVRISIFYFTRPSISKLADKVPLYDEVELEKTITSADITAVRNLTERLMDVEKIYLIYSIFAIISPVGKEYYRI